jgi:GT2 family glycosyltransferase
VKPAVVIPVFGRWDLVETAVRSVRHTCDADVIVVDDGSPTSCPGSVRLLADLVIRHDTNRGFAAACNTGVGATAADVVVFVNSDCVPLPGWLEPLAAGLDYATVIAGPTICAPSGKVQTTGVVVDFSAPFGREAVEITHPVDSGPRDAVTGACMAVWRDWLVDGGGFDEGYLNGYEDVDLCLRAGRCWYAADSHVIHHESQSGPERWRAVSENVSRLRAKWGAP